MRKLDDALTAALRREEPPAGFAERVLSRAGEQPAIPAWGPRAIEFSRPGLSGPGISGGSRGPALQGVASPRPSFIQWAAAAVLVAAVTGGVNYLAKQKDRAEGEAAREQVVLALHIAGSKLQIVQTRISQLHEPESNPNQ